MTTSLGIALGIALAASIAAASGSGSAGQADLSGLSRRRILFGHQSVGADILDGVARAGVPGLKVVDVRGPTALAPGSFGHAFVAENHKPLLKLESFEKLLAATATTPPDIAFLKLCFVDFEPATDSAALFRAYQEKMSELARRYPATTFVHLTVPLTVIQSGPKAWAKKLTGRHPYGLVENLRRDEFNALMRSAYQGKAPLFDLARLESTAAGGQALEVEFQGRRVPVLDPAITHDGSHLNEAGQDRIARALLGYLAGLP
jgi:lysophospholipase L1-like esterase